MACVIYRAPGILRADFIEQYKQLNVFVDQQIGCTVFYCHVVGGEYIW